MEPTTAILSFALAATLLTLTPGADTALVLRAATRGGPVHGMLAGVGVVTGVLVWGVLAGLGLGAALMVSQLAYRILQIAGALYLVWLALQMFQAALQSNPAMSDSQNGGAASSSWFRRGLLTNLLNPKIGVFYISLLPQFIPTGGGIVGYSLLYAAMHAVVGLLFFAVLVTATASVSQWLRRPAVARTLDSLTGTVLLLFAARLLFSRQSA